MQKKLLPILIIMLFLFSFLVSCNLAFSNADGNGADSGDGKTEEEENENEGGEREEPVGFIYDKDSELYFIAASDADGGIASSLASALDSKRSTIVKFDAQDSPSHKHEIVFGNTDRDISKTALQLLGRYEKNEDSELGFLIYSDGSSVAIVWEEDEDGVIEKLAAEYFTENYINESLTAHKGEMHSDLIDPIEDYYRVIDKEYINDKWDAFEKVAGEELTASFKRLYSIYSEEMILWMANLFDPDICVCVDLYGESECSGTKYCGTSGFYFTNSARDTVGYLPDVESTNQTLNFLSSSGIGYMFGDRYADFLPEEMLEGIARFVIALQEPNGYFYHPQWGIEFTDTKVSRRSRDLNWSESILKNLGKKPTYDTPNGMKGSGVSPTSYKVALMGSDRVSAVSKVLLVSGDSYDPNLQDLDSFRSYLEGLDIRERSYHVGNDLTSQANQIIARDRQIGTEDDPTPLMDYLILWLNENQNPETGHWDYKKPSDSDYDAYYGVNGLLKIGGIYTAAGKVMPYSAEAAKSAMAAITDPTEIDAVVDLYNTWFSIRNILENLRKCGDADDKAMADEIVAELRADASYAVEVSRTKISVFRKNDGSFSYSPKYSSSHAQGCPAAVPNSVEGDVNGNNIASTGLITYMLGALDLLDYRVPLYGEADRRVFINTVENLSPITKVEDITVPEPITFEYDKTGEPSEEIELQLNPNTGSSANVVFDPTDSGMGKVTELVSHKGGGDYLRVNNNTVSSLAKTAVFEGDFCIAYSDVEYSVQFKLVDLYMLAFKVKDGTVNVKEVSSSTSANGTEEELGVSAELGKWFSLRVEYYPGDHDSVRIKVYADTDLSDGREMKLYAVSDNYFDEIGTKYLKPKGKPSSSYKGIELYVMSSPNLTMYLDNVNCYLSKAAYTQVTDPNSQPFYNVDAPDKEEIKYGFEEGTLPEGLTASGDEIGVSEGEMKLSYGGFGNAPTVDFPLTVRTKGARCASVSFDITFESVASASRIVLRGKDGGSDIFGIDLVGSGGEVKLIAVGMGGETPIEDAKIAVGEKHTVKIEYYHAEDITFVYVDGSYVGKSESLYSGGNKATMDSFSVSVSGSVKASLDNVTVERIKKSFEDATKPIVDSKIYDFEGEVADVALGDGASYSDVSGDGVVEMLGAKGSLTVPFNYRATLYNLAFAEFEISLKNTPSGGITQTIEFLSRDGSVIATLALVRNGSRLELYEYAKDGIMQTPLYIYQGSDRVKITVKVFAENKMMFVYNNGVAVAKSSIFFGEENLREPFGALRIRNTEASSAAVIDDVCAETLYELYTDLKVNSKGNEESDLRTPLTFEWSSSGNLPSPVGQGLSGIGSALRVERVEKDEGYSNALAFYTAPGSNDFINFTATEGLGGYSAVAFEADIMIDNFTEGSTTCYQIYFSKKDSKDKSYFIQLYKDGDTFSIVDKSDSNNDGNTKTHTLKTGIKQGEWFKFKVEYYRGTKDDVRFVISINGEIVSVSNNFFGSSSASASPAREVECFYFYTLNKCDGVLYYDNVTMYGHNGSFDGELTLCK